MEDYLELIEQERYYYFYLICLRKHIDTQNKVFKLGRSWRVNGRFKGYPKDSVLLYLCRVKDAYHVEHEMIKVFNHKFTLAKEIGYEYFRGNINDMIQCASSVIEYMNQKLDDDFSSIRVNYKKRLKFKLDEQDEINNDDYEFIFKTIDKEDINNDPKTESQKIKPKKKWVNPHKMTTEYIVTNIIECCKKENENTKQKY